MNRNHVCQLPILFNICSLELLGSVIFVIIQVWGGDQTYLEPLRLCA